MDDEKTQLEEQFILRLPKDEAREIRNMINYKPERISKYLKMDLNTADNSVTVSWCNKRLYGALKKLPTIVESYKTNICNNRSNLFKTADICYMAACSKDVDEITTDKVETIHGLCPPLKNVKKKRFRKTLFNKELALEAEWISKELYYLLSTDLEAISSKFEIIYEDPTKALKQYEKSLFGQLSSDSDEQSEGGSN
ncbi:unnamed protein product [Acanthoscelides obtectus]|uniref:TAFII55 protein conserved region domain-containing protein n=1 Tax=Acanthoscelides obtectus TaxID=200917 RepID=A0A9P0JTS5_ACAOB|nr:unnamed protein product [Acanthoscelides obtectus]CAK1642974.1 Transcription initiation factor TFIID subunit 7 [Acanthoscelides obtectus]